MIPDIADKNIKMNDNLQKHPLVAEKPQIVAILQPQVAALKMHFGWTELNFGLFKKQ